MVTEESQYVYQSIRFDNLNTVKPFLSLYLVSVRRYKQNKCKCITSNGIEKGHWFKSHLHRHDWHELWSSWRFQKTDNETAAVPTQACRWIDILAWHGIEKEVTDQRSFESGDRNSEEWYTIVKHYGIECFVAICRFLGELFVKKRGRSDPPPISPRVNLSQYEG